MRCSMGMSEGVACYDEVSIVVYPWVIHRRMYIEQRRHVWPRDPTLPLVE